MLARNLLVLGRTPCDDGGENDSGGSGILDECEVAPQFGHHVLGVEHIAEEALLVRRGEVFDLAADARRDLWRHFGLRRVKSRGGGSWKRDRTEDGRRIE